MLSVDCVHVCRLTFLSVFQFNIVHASGPTCIAPFLPFALLLATIVVPLICFAILLLDCVVGRLLFALSSPSRICRVGHSRALVLGFSAAVNNISNSSSFSSAGCVQLRSVCALGGGDVAIRL